MYLHIRMQWSIFLPPSFRIVSRIFQMIYSLGQSSVKSQENTIRSRNLNSNFIEKITYPYRVSTMMFGERNVLKEESNHLNLCLSFALVASRERGLQFLIRKSLSSISSLRLSVERNSQFHFRHFVLKNEGEGDFNSKTISFSINVDVIWLGKISFQLSLKMRKISFGIRKTIGAISSTVLLISKI